MKSWIFYVIICITFWGIWGFLAKIATKFLDPRQLFIYQGIGNLCVVLAIVFYEKKIDFNWRGSLLALLVGVLGMLGALSFWNAIKTGPVAVTSSITALYPSVAVILALIFLKETLSLKQIIGVILALIAGVLLAS